MAASMKYMGDGQRVKKDQAFLTRFTNGRLTNSANLNYGYFKSDSERTSERRILVAESKSLSYIGLNYGRKAHHAREHVNYMVGVRDKTSGEMKVYDTESYIMRPRMDALDDGIDQTDEQEEPTPSMVDKWRDLTEDFGNERKRKALKSREANAMVSKTVGRAFEASPQAKSSQKSSRGDASSEEDSDDSSNELQNTMSALLPASNPDALAIAHIFPINNVLPYGLLESLKEAAKKFHTATKNDIKTWGKEKTYSGYVTRLLLKKLGTTDHLHTSCYIMFLSYMMELYNVKKQGPMFSDDIPIAVKHFILVTFTTLIQRGSGMHGKRATTRKLKDKLILFIIVLILHLDEFEVDLKILGDDLKMTQTKITPYALTTFCKIEKKTEEIDGISSTKNHAVLHLPMPSKGSSPRKNVKRKLAM